ncbi:MAG: DNA sulfur modification protein DndD [Lachnospiraceae bacterium]|nr:DNA sulfur modification protein DndD [Lachnospiraceae bacterium]
MKFESIVLHNFMRYKGENRIDFSCDDTKNVTIVLGDNTVGKTTLAQAFRFGLYGHILVENGKKESDYVLLNKDVIEFMDEKSHGTVGVEITILNRDKRYILRREIIYCLKLIRNQLELKETESKLHLREEKISDTSVAADIQEDKIQSVINEMFPGDLSSYFLFDGEKWRDIRHSGVRDDIKESVHKLTGLSAAQKAMYHLKDMGSGSVISEMKRNIQGSGQIYDNIQNDIDRSERKKKNALERIALNENQIEKHEQEIQNIELWLEDNKSTEQLQKSIRTARIVLSSREKNVHQTYKQLRDKWSNEPWTYFSRPMMDEALEVLKKTDRERRDIPHMHQSTIDYLIKRGKCICGTAITNESEAFAHLMEQRNYLPPADIGTLLGNFEKTASRWQRKYDDYRESVLEAAAEESDAIREYDEAVLELRQMEGKIEKNIDFNEKRSDMSYHKSEMNKLTSDIYAQKEIIQRCEKDIGRLEQEKSTMELKNKNNQLWKQRVAFAETIYEQLSEEYTQKEKKLFLSLNQGIQQNFDKMFNSKDKKISLDSKYHINMEYRNEKGGYTVENNLSEGEKVARNFAFIVTIMEYSMSQKKQDENMADTLPIVLDGPFSKLGQENIGLISHVLPDISEQVIIFMLKKDWNYTGLDGYVGKRYIIEKKPEESYAAIKEVM